MNRLVAVIATPLLLLCASVGAAAQPRLAFEVVSIKTVPRPTPETVRNGTSHIGAKIQADRVDIAGYGLKWMVAQAFGVQVQQVDLRGFEDTQSFEVQAKFPAGATRGQVPEMLQTMLAERFKLVYHRENREYPVTVLSVGKGGMKLQRLPDGTKPSSSTRELGVGITRFTQTDTVKSLFPVMNSFGGLDQMVDETGLDGMYTWVRDQVSSPGMSYQDIVQEAFKAMIDAAGLKLEPRKVPKDTIVVDHAEELPTEN